MLPRIDVEVGDEFREEAKAETEILSLYVARKRDQAKSVRLNLIAASRGS